jgi:hypothetical protein
VLFCKWAAASFFFSIIICSNLRTYLFCGAMQIPPGNSTKPLGVQVLESRGQFAEAYWYWIGVGALVGYIIIFNIGFTLAIAFMPGELIHTLSPTTPMDPEAYHSKRTNALYIYWVPDLQGVPNKYTLLITFKCFYFVT